jgi:hypothetical protein
MLPTLSAPRGHRSILAEVRAPPPAQIPINNLLLPHLGSAIRARREKEENRRAKKTSPQGDQQQHHGSHGSHTHSVGSYRSSTIAQTPGVNINLTQQERRAVGTMSKGSKGGKSTKMEPSTWLSGFTSRADSAGPSRLSSGSRPPSTSEREGGAGAGSGRNDSGIRNRSESHGQEETIRGHDSGAALLEE